MMLRRVHWWVCRRRGAAIWALMMVIGTWMLIYLTQNRFTFSELTTTPEEKIHQELMPTSSGKKSSILKNTKDLPVEDGFSRAEYLRSACKNNIHRSGNRKVRVSFDPHVNAVYCPLCKIASTFLTRMFRMIALNNRGLPNGTVYTPFDVPISDAPPSTDNLDLNKWTVGNKDATLRQFKSLDAMEAKSSNLHADDAIQDSVSGPYEWRKDIVKCMSWPDALRRIWRKLQIRGVIGTKGFSLSEFEAESISRTDYINVLKKVREKSTANERHMMKQLSYIEAYRNIPEELLDSIKH
ncbi:hypothetical protein MAR_009472, partial [Mya arenaria]